MVRVMAPVPRGSQVRNGNCTSVGCVNGRCRSFRNPNNNRIDPDPMYPVACQFMKHARMTLGKEKYDDLVQTFKDFKSGLINVTEVIRRVEELFQGNAHLIDGFNQFVPARFKFMKHARMTLGKEKYDDFLQVLKDFKSGSTNLTEVIGRAEELFQGDVQLIAGFNQFVPTRFKVNVP